MYNRIFKDNNGKEWERIDKRKARRLYNQGETLVIAPENMRPFTMWCYGLDININNDIMDFTNIQHDFDTRIRDFEIYNCINSETGYRAAFYMEVK